MNGDLPSGKPPFLLIAIWIYKINDKVLQFIVD